jgi:hypothetical protein
VYSEAAAVVSEQGGVRAASAAQHAVRVLFLLREAGEAANIPPDPEGTISVIRSEVRLHALDFWLRNPDYLADELLTEVEGGRLDSSYVSVARGLLLDPEPQLRVYPMHRWIFGAFEPLDDALASLETPGLVRINRSGRPGQIYRTQVFLTTAGKAAADKLEAAAPDLGWYVKQARIVMAVARDDKGSNLKRRQYKQADYADTELGSRIASIRDRVRARLEAMSGQPA